MALSGAGLPGLPGELRAAATERIVINRHSGLAIDGFDPVAYFTDREAALGLAGIETSAAGVVWRFRSEANRVAFEAHPDIYGPQFGGYDPVDVARGRPVPGRAQIWLISGERLYLFSQEENRAAFAADPALLERAGKSWPALKETLADY